MKKFLKRNKARLVSAVIAAMAVVTATFGASAESATDIDVAGLMSSSMSTVSSSIYSVIGTILPIALGILGVTLAIKFGIRYFKSLTNKAGG